MPPVLPFRRPSNEQQPDSTPGVTPMRKYRNSGWLKVNENQRPRAPIFTGKCQIAGKTYKTAIFQNIVNGEERYTQTFDEVPSPDPQ